MAKHEVKCAVCGKIFDLNKEQGVKFNARRYAHQTCYPEGELVPLPQVDNDLQKLNDYIAKIYGDKANYPLIKKQIKKFQEQGYSLSGILKSLVYFYEVKGNSIEKSNGGIGICEYVYQDAYNYYLALFMAQQANEQVAPLEHKIREVTIKPPKAIKKKRLFKFLEEDDENE